jgi:hypothetical protein
MFSPGAAAGGTTNAAEGSGRVMDPYETLGITPAYEGDLRALRARLVKRYFEAGDTPF